MNRIILHENKLYIQTEGIGIAPIILLLDSIRFTYFGKSSKTYMLLDDAIQWYQNESTRTDNKKALERYADALIILQEIRAKNMEELKKGDKK